MMRRNIIPQRLKDLSLHLQSNYALVFIKNPCCFEASRDSFLSLEMDWHKSGAVVAISRARDA